MLGYLITKAGSVCNGKAMQGQAPECGGLLTINSF